jgi:hypothetical protein
LFQFYLVHLFHRFALQRRPPPPRPPPPPPRLADPRELACRVCEPPPPPPLNALCDEPDELGRLALCDEEGRLAVCDDDGRLAVCDDDGRLAVCDDDGRLAVCDEEGRLAFGDEDGRLALGDDCRSPDGPVGLSCELPEDARGVVDPERVDGEADRCAAAVDWFAPEP